MRMKIYKILTQGYWNVGEYIKGNVYRYKTIEINVDLHLIKASSAIKDYCAFCYWRL